MKLEEELRTVLREDGPSDAQRNAWVEAALRSSPQEGSRPPRRPAIWIVAAAAVLAIFVLQQAREEGSPPVGETRPTDSGDALGQQRAVNHKALKASRDELWEESKDKYAAVAKGEIHISKKLADAIDWLGKRHAAEHQCFLFRIDATPPYDIIADRSPVAQGIVGIPFLDAAGIKLTGKPGEWWIRRGSHVRISKDPIVNLVIEGRAMRFRIETKSLCPIMLPAKSTYPRAEIPGTALFEGLDRKWRSYQRYLVRVQNKSLGLDMWMEAAGARYEGAIAPGNLFGVRLGGHVFQSLHEDPFARVQREGRPLLVLHLADKDTEKLNTLFDSLAFDGYSQAFVPNAKKSSLRRYRKDGILDFVLPLPASAAVIRKTLR